MLTSIFRKVASILYFPVEAVLEERARRLDAYRDYRQESRKLDKYSNQELIDTMDRDKIVSVADIRKILRQLSARKEFNFNDNDSDYYVGPVFNHLLHRINRNEFEDYIECFIRLEEDLKEHARIRVGDLLDVLADFELPGGEDDAPKARETVAVAIDHDFDESTWLGRLQKRMNDTAPLRTPSVPVRYEDREMDQPLNIKRPFVLAIGFAALYKDQTRAVEAEEIPTFRDTFMERKYRAQRPGPERVYRGQRYD